MAFRILNQFPVYSGLAGLPAAGGELRFYQSGTTTPKSVYGGPNLTPDNGSTVEIGSDGRTVVDVWGDGEYRVRLYAADNTLIDEADNVEIPGGDEATIPALVDGYFLTNNGSLLLWAPIRQLPDPTGQDGKAVVADGAGYILKPFPAAPPPPPDPEIIVAANSFQAGVSDDTNKFRAIRGTGSAPASGSHRTSMAVTFPESFTDTPFVSLSVTAAGICASGEMGGHSITSLTSAGFTANFDVNVDDDRSMFNIIAPVPFIWLAVGNKTVAPAP